MRFYTNKTKKDRETNNQMTFDYALYMIVSSYFDKVACKNRIHEDRLYLRYVETKIEKQFSMEDHCIHYVENNLISKLPDSFWKKDTQVSFLHVKCSAQTAILFQNEIGKLLVTASYKGKQTKIVAKFFIHSQKVTKNAS